VAATAAGSNSGQASDRNAFKRCIDPILDKTALVQPHKPGQTPPSHRSDFLFSPAASEIEHPRKRQHLAPVLPRTARFATPFRRIEVFSGDGLSPARDGPSSYTQAPCKERSQRKRPHKASS